MPTTKYHDRRNGALRRSPVTLYMVATSLLAGCTATGPVAHYEVQRHRLALQLEPADHHLAGRSTLELASLSQSAGPAEEPVAVVLLLHPSLRITRAEAAGARVLNRRLLDPPAVEAAETDAPARHQVVLDRRPERLTLFVEFEGRLQEDVLAGEKPGEIHNFAVDAHVSPEGVFLGGDQWYPQTERPAGTRPPLIDFELAVAPVEGLELAAGADRIPATAAAPRTQIWRTPYPVSHLAVVGGPHRLHERVVEGINVRLHLKPDQDKHTETLFAAAGQVLERYQPLIGPYPATEYAIVDNFFSSGFAFPTFTLLSSAVINMGERAAFTHGYIDHEMLHSWWGNGVFVDPLDGNWCEALTSYAANYYGYVLDGDESEARRKRRNYVHFLSRLEPDEDKPLGTFGQNDGCGRGIAYQKGAMVFHMLARKMGQENFWAAMRRLTDEYVGRYASWGDIQRLCEEVSGESLDAFFHQWVRRNGAPMLMIEHSTFNSSEQLLNLELYQGDPAFNLDVPVRVTHAAGEMDLMVSFNEPSATMSVPVDVIPLSVEIDPDFHVFRKVPPDQIVPTTAATRSGDALVTVLPGGDVAEQYAALQKTFESSFKDGRVATVTAGSMSEGALADSSVLILGEAVADPYVNGFLTAIEFPVRFTESGFEFKGEEYTDPGDAVLATVRHPDVTEGGVTVLYANSREGIPRAMLIPFYEHSMVIFRNGQAERREDFEPRQAVEVEAQ